MAFAELELREGILASFGEAARLVPHAVTIAVSRCATCGAPAEADRALCPAHLEVARRRMARVRRSRSATCADCSSLALEGRRRCARHLALAAARAHRFAELGRARRDAFRAELGIERRAGGWHFA